jgi:hypothetical protein
VVPPSRRSAFASIFGSFTSALSPLADELGSELCWADGVLEAPSLALSFWESPFIIATPMPITTAATTAIAPISRPLVLGPRPRPPAPPL